MALVDEPYRSKQHAGAEVQMGLEEKVQVGLFESDFTLFLAALNQRVFQFEFAPEFDARREAVSEQQDKAVEVEFTRLATKFVEVRLHVAGRGEAGLRLCSDVAGWGACVNRLFQVLPVTSGNVGESEPSSPSCYAGSVRRMNIERTIEFILQFQARAEVRMERMEARFDKEVAAINKLLRQGPKMIAQTQRQLKELAAAQRATERSLQAFLESLRRGANGRR